MKNFIIADLRLFDNEQRIKMGYDNFRIMNDFIINSWNKVVSSEDKIILMGDIGNATFE